MSSHVRSIHGLMSDAELDWLVSCCNAAADGYVVELGTFCGRSAAVMAVEAGRTVHTFDTYHYKKGPYKPNAIKNQRRIEQHNVHGVKFYTRDTCAPPIAAVQEPAVLFIDSEHTAERVHRELSIWLPLLARTQYSVLVLHDLGHPKFKGYTEYLEKEIFPRLKEQGWADLGRVDTLHAWRNDGLDE